MGQKFRRTEFSSRNQQVTRSPYFQCVAVVISVCEKSGWVYLVEARDDGLRGRPFKLRFQSPRRMYANKRNGGIHFGQDGDNLSSRKFAWIKGMAVMLLAAPRPDLDGRHYASAFTTVRGYNRVVEHVSNPNFFNLLKSHM